MTIVKTLAAAAAGTLFATSAFAQSASTNLFLLEELADISRTRELAESDLDALHAVADWIKTFLAMPHKDLGRAGAVCPFVPVALERKTLWLVLDHHQIVAAVDIEIVAIEEKIVSFVFPDNLKRSFFGTPTLTSAS
jgi:hypothetical protein